MGYYPRASGNDGDFELGRGFINSDTNVSIAGRIVTAPEQTPLVADLDGDGIQEIIILDNGQVRLFTGHLLTITDSSALSDTGSHGNMYIFDIDADGYKEVIVANEDIQKIDVLEYNGSHFRNQTILDYGGLSNAGDGQTMIGCASSQTCVLAYIKEDNSLGGSTRDYMTAVGFGTGGFATPVQISQTIATPPVVFCMPKIKAMPHEDYDNDGEDEFILSYLGAHTTSNEYYEIAYLYINSSNHITLEQLINKQMDSIFNEGTIQCEESVDDYDPGNYITSALVFDVDGSSSNGLETIVGVQYDSNEFKMHSWYADGSFYDDYPEVFHADGVIISNIVRAHATSSTSSSEEFCVMGFDDDNMKVDLLCASEQSSGADFTLIDNDEFMYDVSAYYNISKEYDFYNNMIHAVQYSAVTHNGQDLSEFLTPFGIFTLDFVGANELLLHYENPKPDAVMISDDVEGVGREDLIAMTSSAIWYLDDGYTKNPGEIDAYSINPCIDSTWLVNETVSVSVTVIDPDNDLVTACASLYYGESYNQTECAGINASSGTSFPFTFKANHTTGTGVLRLTGWDDDMPSNVDTIDVVFSVGTSGVSHGECITVVDVTTTVEEAEETTPTGVVIDAFTGSIEDIDDMLGTGFGTAVWWLLFMSVVAVGIWKYAENVSDKASVLGMVAIAEIILFIVGLKLGFYGYGTLTIVIVLALALITFKWSPWKTGGG